jgi:hypothetical protein
MEDEHLLAERFVARNQKSGGTRACITKIKEIE